MSDKQVKQSRFLSLVLRHQPRKIGIQLDDAGWTDVDVLLSALKTHGQTLTLEELTDIVHNNDKQRFQFNDDATKIRATQGHSVNVDLGYLPVRASDVPEILQHGTPAKFVESIRKGGLKKMSRHHVHMHQNHEVAQAVGDRRGDSVILKVNARKMADAGHVFFVTPNEVWLTDVVPPQFITFPE